MRFSSTDGDNLDFITGKQSILILVLLIVGVLTNVTQILMNSNLLAHAGLTTTELAASVHEVSNACGAAFLSSGSEA